MSKVVNVWDFCYGAKSVFCYQVHGEVLALSDSRVYVLQDGILTIITFDCMGQTIYTPNAVTQIAINEDSVLFLLETQEIWGYSSDPFSPLFPNPDSSASNLQKIDLTDILSISLGKHHAAALNKSNQLFTWGKLTHIVQNSKKPIKQGPILQQSNGIFTIEQISCGNSNTILRTQGGYIYIFGNLPKSVSCSYQSTPRDSPYTIPSLESEYFTHFCQSEEFVAGLSSGKIFVFDACMKPISLAIRHKEITFIASNKKILLGIDSYRLFLWQFGIGASGCGLENWDVKVLLLNSAFDGNRVLGGLENYFLFETKNQGVIGTVLNSGEYKHEILIEKVQNKCVEKCNKDMERGISLMVDGFRGYLRYFFAKFVGRSRGGDGKDYEFCRWADEIVKKKIGWVWKQLKIGLKPQQKENKISRTSVIFLMLVLSKKFQKIFSKFFNSWKISKKLSKKEALNKILLKLYKKKLIPIFHLTINFKTIQQKSLLFCIFATSMKQKQIIAFLEKSKTLQKFKSFTQQSKKAIENSPVQKKYNYKITPINQIQLKSTEALTTPLNRADHSPRNPNRKLLTKDSRVKSKPRALSKPINLEKSKPSEKSKPIKKSQQYTEESKTRQIKSKLLKLTHSNSKETDFERSPLSPSRIPGCNKLSAFVFILSGKVRSTLRHVLYLLRPKSHSSSFSFAPDKTELLPSIAPEIWKIKVFSLGINKLNAFTKRHLKHSVFNYLFSSE